MTNNPPARLLDLTRLVRRAGRVLTGVDRVEMAYLRRLVADDVPAFGLVRTSLGYVLFDRAGMGALAQRLDGSVSWSTPDLRSRLARGQTAVQRAAQTDVRKLAIARTLPRGLGAMLRRHLPQGTTYLNTGHSNLTDRVLQAAQGLGGRIGVFVHDVIPLEYPQFQRPETVEPFRAKMRRVQACADVIICNSADTLDRAGRLMAQWGPVPEGIVAHLGTDLSIPQPDLLPDDLPPAGPYFVSVGTIEPRKNHALLLDVWDAMGAEAPTLVICGARGWNNAAVFARLDSRTDTRVIERAGLSDGAVAALLAGSCGLLFPSFAEGYGLPPVEAAALGVPVVANDLPVIREILGNIPVYVPADDRYLWEKTIKDMAEAGSQGREKSQFQAPGWSQHFNTVLRSL
ncbi:glycosyltransferase family 1 protein [uncultured Pseudosulfitobacter sp.]|uniref:glycosyltransferase family 4 protein n=1 Tax=uncultured Pseudosulfitobacter sp. TaxID=2854214 RepID=UPI0030D9FD10